LPPEVVTAEGDPAEIEGGLAPEEQAQVTGAVDKRLIEFRAGRVLARGALQRLRAPAGPLLAEGTRAPRWPDGIVGSITHTRRFCGVAVARASAALAALGIDAEPDEPLRDELISRILTERERAYLKGRESRERGRIARLFFCGKEALYKCQSPVTGRFLEFQEVELDLDLDGGRFGARYVGRAPGLALDVVEGRFLRAGGLIFVGCVADHRLARPGGIG
jgi:4'-phosphopantetheinyl transferase EntD